MSDLKNLAAKKHIVNICNRIYKNALILIAIFALISVISCRTFAGDIKGKVHFKGTNSNEGVLVYIETVHGKFSPPNEKIIMDQKNLRFYPKLLPILVGSTVTFLNNDNVLHNVFSPDKCPDSFDLGTWPKGKFKTHSFNKANCFIRILCNVHPDMQAWIVVLQNPYFVKADSLGEYEIKDVPEGKYKLKVWRPFHKTLSKEVIVRKSGIIRKDFN
jgi:plastocyanin